MLKLHRGVRMQRQKRAMSTETLQRVSNPRLTKGALFPQEFTTPCQPLSSSVRHFHPLFTHGETESRSKPPARV